MAITKQTSPLDDDIQLQRTLLQKISEVNQKGRANRIGEVQNARDQRLYFRGIQEFYWSDDAQDVVFNSDDDSPYDRVFNVFQGYGKIFQATFLGATPKVRPEADDPFDSASIRATAKARTWERIYRKNNDISSLQMEIARLLYTDGRVVTITEEDESNLVKTRTWGVLESRLSLTAKTVKDCPLIEIEDEFPIVQLKRDYPDARAKINSGNGDSYERNSRIAVKRKAGSDTVVDVLTGEDNYGLATKTWSYVRPEFFEEFEEANRTQFQGMFPNGCCIVHNGDVYLASYEFDIDAHIDIIHALPGDGMARPSIGAPLMPVQDSVNTVMNLTEETFDHGIPTTYYDTETNIDSLNKQREMPGASRKMTRKAGTPAEDHFFETQAVEPSSQLFEYGELLRGPFAQFITGQQPALFGGQMEDQKTASGYAQARAMALGQMAIIWKPFTSWYARENTRAVKLASAQTEEIKSTLKPETPGGHPEAVRILPGELQGASFTNDSDENFPQTWTEKSNKFLQLLQSSGPLGVQILQEEPDNLYLAKQMLGLEELVIPGEDLRNNVLADIAQMETMPLTPDPTQMPQQAIPPVGAPPVQPQYVSPIEVDTDFMEPNDFTTGFKVVKRWLQSSAGQEAKIANTNWYKNVQLYGLQYKQGMMAAQQANAPLPPDLPKVHIPYQALPTDGKVQAAAKAGIQLNPQDVMAATAAEAAQNTPAVQ